MHMLVEDIMHNWNIRFLPWNVPDIATVCEQLFVLSP
jgi:hypothetical protein